MKGKPNFNFPLNEVLETWNFVHCVVLHLRTLKAFITLNKMLSVITDLDKINTGTISDISMNRQPTQGALLEMIRMIGSIRDDPDDRDYSFRTRVIVHSCPLQVQTPKTPISRAHIFPHFHICKAIMCSRNSRSDKSKSSWGTHRIYWHWHWEHHPLLESLATVQHNSCSLGSEHNLPPL